MRILILLFLNTIFLSIAAAQPSPDTIVVHFMSTMQKLAVSPDEKLMVTTAAGEVATTENVSGLWTSLYPFGKREDGLGSFTIEQAGFFNTDTGFVSGFIKNPKSEKYDVILHTIDGGKNWQYIRFGDDGWADGGTHLPDGKAWMSIAGKGIAYSENYGLTWKHLPAPDYKQRFSTLFFINKDEGIMGSIWDMIAITHNNCMDWKLLPTPLDQRKYVKTNPEARPEVRNVAIFHDYYFADQEGLIFYTKKDSINWIRMPAYVGFYTDATNKHIFFQLKNGAFIKADAQLKTIRSFAPMGVVSAARYQNDKLFVMLDGSMAVLDKDSIAQQTPMRMIADEYHRPEIAMIGFFDDKIYGNIGNQFYVRPGSTQTWLPSFNLPFDIANAQLSMPDQFTVLAKFSGDSLVSYDIQTKKVVLRSTNKVLADFCRDKIVAITFSKSSIGCFQNEQKQVTFRKNGELFEFFEEKGKSRSADLRIPAAEPFGASLVDDFLVNIPATVSNDPGVAELEFTASNYKNCKKDILKFQRSIGKKANDNQSFYLSENDIDFPKLLSLIDTVKTLSPVELKTCLADMERMFSTTVNGVYIELQNVVGEKMIVYSNFYEANYFFFPWNVFIAGTNFRGNWPGITDFVDKVFPGFLNARSSKVKVLNNIVARLYEMRQ